MYSSCSRWRRAVAHSGSPGRKGRTGRESNNETSRHGDGAPHDAFRETHIRCPSAKWPAAPPVLLKVTVKLTFSFTSEKRRVSGLTATATPAGSVALDGFTCPAPVAKRLAGWSFSSLMPSPLRSTASAVVMIADFTAAGDQLGWALRTSAAIPVRCGVDMEGHAAMMLTPGPVMSGLRIPGLAWLGPREENEATAGDGDVPMSVPLTKKDTVAL
ncbi:unnamed protein product [Spirodela intermedia]|uniref:Uncharacterized protein n=1 Tax=Spirodela intermedia TaxID=51605 RepID=A0A7I8J247_SPIIN|nr:unnamed protein product [Spirodela intermedia]CAA6663390.1 unnamed protein product [Spirodela intermedia]